MCLKFNDCSCKGLNCLNHVSVGMHILTLLTEQDVDRDHKSPDVSRGRQSPPYEET